MKNEYRNAESIGIIGGADGPTSVFTAGKGRKQPFKVRIHKYIYQHKRKRAARKIVAGTHTLEEMLVYAVNTYSATEANHKLGELPSISRVYEIKAGSDYLDIEIDDTRGTFGVSFSGNNKAMKYFRTIAKDLYIYYGVSENDISKKTERYLSLLGILSL